MTNLLDIPDNVDIVEIRREISKLVSEARSAAKPNMCFLCGKVQTSFCNSHSVPQLSLKNIASNGMLMQASSLMGIEVVDTEKGVNNSGTFQFICNKCDGTFFKDYEEEQNLKVKPTDKMLGEIAVKNFLLQLSKRKQEFELHKLLQSRFNMYTSLNDISKITELDVKEFEEEILFHKDIVDKGISGGYQILFWKLLPYKVPLAVQSAIALSVDFQGNEINCVSDLNEEVRMQYMHLAIFPLKSESIVLAFYHKRDKLYRTLRHAINSIAEEKVLQYINYLIFAYTENYYLSKNIKEVIETDEKLALLGQENNGNPNLGFLCPDNYFGIGYQPVSMNEIPNFLFEEWAIKDKKD